MKPITAFAAYSLQAAAHLARVLKVECTANAGLAAGCFLQVHDSAVVPAEGAVPVKSWPLTAGAEQYKSFDVNELTLSQGCYVCVSTTEATKTLGTGNNKFNTISVELALADEPASVSYAGDLTTAIDGLQVWSEAAGLAARKRLLAVQVVSIDLSDPHYIQLFARDTVADGDKPIQQWYFDPAVPMTGVNALRFGVDGLDVFNQTAAYVKEVGCTLKLSTSAGSYAAPSETVAIKAEYK